MATQIRTADIADSQVTDAKLASGISGGKIAASPELTGTPTAPTATAGDSSTQIATTAFVAAAVAGAAPSNEPAASLSVPANATMVFWGDPLTLDSGIVLSIAAGGVVVLEAQEGSADNRQVGQNTSQPAGGAILYPGYYTSTGGIPLTLDSGVVYEIGAGAVLDLGADAGAGNFPRVLFSGRVNNSVTGTTNDLVGFSYPIPAGLLGTGGHIRVTAVGRRPTGVGNVTWKLKYGGSRIDNSGAVSSSPVVIMGHLMADGSAAAQRSAVTNLLAGSTSSTSASGSPLAVDSTALKNLTVEVALATASDIVTIDNVIIEQLS